MKSIEKIRGLLMEHQDLGYKDFHCKLMLTVNPDKVLGVRNPVIRQLAKELKGTKEVQDFLKTLPHDFYEENNLHGCLIESMKDFEETVDYIQKFLPYIDNWATCDSLSPKILKKHKEELLPFIYQWMESSHTYTKRFAIRMLMVHFLEEQFDRKYLERVSKIRSEEYYVNMMVAWYFSVALVKQYEETLPFFLQPYMEKWTHNKAIQKARESYRVPKERKDYLNTLKIK